jgi:hypothetical protein
MINFLSSKGAWQEITTFVIADLIVVALTAIALYLRSVVVAHKSAFMKVIIAVSVIYFELATIYSLLAIWARSLLHMSLGIVWFNLFLVLAGRLLFMTVDYFASWHNRSSQEKTARLLSLHQRLPQATNTGQEVITFILNEVVETDKHGQRVMRKAEWKLTYYLFTTALAIWSAIFFALKYR